MVDRGRLEDTRLAQLCACMQLATVGNDAEEQGLIKALGILFMVHR